MSEEWIVRVDGKEYGPVDTDELREWRREGRLIPANEVRQEGEERWILAGELPEVFADPVAAPPPLPCHWEKPKAWSELITDTVRLYRAGFVWFMIFGLLTAVPMFLLQWTLPPLPPLKDVISGSSDTASVPVLPPVSISLLLILVFLWPISTAGFQVVADKIVRGQPGSLGDYFSGAIRAWGRVLGAAILVFASYLFWIFVPLAAMLAPVNTGNLLLVVVVTLLSSLAMVYMNARLFINFLFWHQTSVIEERPPFFALNESKDLARSCPQAPPLDRPLYRGVIFASVWLLLLIALIFGVNLILVMIRIAGATDVEQAMEMTRKMAEAQTPDGLMIATNLLGSLINLLLRPFLAAAFVVLYYDAKARSGKGRENERPE